MTDNSKTELAIIGSGPSGLTAAIYAARANLEPIVFEGIEPGGQLITTTLVENFPGFPEGIMGPELMENMRQQAQRFGARLIPDIVNEINLDNRPFKLNYGDNQIMSCSAVVIATGASAKWLNLASEQKMRGRGVSSCATCDGFFFRGKKVAVVGGGDTAMEDALHLTRFASEVLLIHRRDSLRASKYMQLRVMENPKIKLIWNSQVVEVLGNDSTGVTGIKVLNVQSGLVADIPIDGLFVAIGHNPNTGFLKGQLTLDSNGFIQVKRGEVETSIPGVYVAGDVIDPRFRQAITAAGMGCMAAIRVQEFLETNPIHSA